MKFKFFLNESERKITVFHSTLSDRAESILKKGLIPGFEEPSGQTWKGEYSGKGIYFHQALPEHELDYSIIDDILTIVTFEVELPLIIEKIVPDEDSGLPPTKDGTLEALKRKEAIVFLGKIPPNSIKALWVPDDEDNESIFAEYLENEIPKKYRRKVKNYLVKTN